MKIYREPDFVEDFRNKTPAVSSSTRQWMDEFICELGEQMYQNLGEAVDWEGDLHVIPGIEVSGFIPFTNGGLRLTLMARLEADADSSHYPAFPCVRKELAALTENMEHDFERVEGVPVAEAEHEQYWGFVDSWNEGCDAYVDYIFEVWQNMDKVQVQAYISLDDERTAVRNVWYVGELPDPIEAVEDLIPVIMTAWEGRI